MRKAKKDKRTPGILAGSGDDDSDGPAGGEDLSSIQSNEGYARRDEAPPQRIEERGDQSLQLPASDEMSDEEDEDEESSEEDDAIIASRRVDRRVFEAIRRIRSGGDGGVYSSSWSEDDAEEEEHKQVKRKVSKEKPLYLKDVNARHLLDEGTEATAQTGRSSKYDRIAYDGEQKKGLEAFLEAQKEVLGAGDGDGDDDLFQVKPKVGAGDDDRHEEEDEEQTMELAGEVFGDDEELDENEKFLKEFFLKRPYLESGKESKSYLNDIQELSEEEELEKQEQYEHAYNYRHDEAVASGAVVAERVTGHSRVVEGSVRKKESSRKQQRKSKGEREAQAKQEQVEELKHLKNLKKKEIVEKLERIRMIAGHDACHKLGVDDLEEDFDPEDYDRKMQEMFGDSYYEADDVDPEFRSGEEMDLEKTDFGKEDNFLELPKDWSWITGKSKDDQSTATDGEATNKGRISLKDKVELGKEMEEYYKLDHEGTIGDLKTRFKYKKVHPNSFGMSAWEILASDDKDLNQYVPMKKLAPYRESEWTVTHHKKLSKDLILGGKKKEGYKDKSGKQSRTEKRPSSSEPADNHEQMNEVEETDVKRKSTRSGRKKRRNGDLKLSRKRKLAYGIIKPKRPKRH